MQYKKVLVTGGAGFIGSHLCERLLRAGVQPVVLDNLSVGKKENLPTGVRLIKGDVQKISSVKRALVGVGAVYHLAANVTVRGSVEKFYADAKTNIMGTLNVLRACRGTGVKKFIFSSSMAVYADSPDPRPIKETYLTEPISPYGVAKLTCEKYIFLACRQMGIESTVLRYFNTYGPRQTFTPYVGVVTIFINRLLEGKSPIIFGDGEQKRDFVYVGDIAEATYRVLSAKTNGRVFNVSTGLPTSVNQIATMLIKEINPGLKPIYQEAHPEELRYSIASPVRLKKATGFRPETKIKDKVKELINYIRSQSKAKK